MEISLYVSSSCCILTVILKVPVLILGSIFCYILTVILKVPVLNYTSMFKILSLAPHFCTFNYEFDRMRIHILSCVSYLSIILNVPELI